MNGVGTWLILGLVVALVVIMMLNSSRQKKANAENQKMIGELKPGDKVRTHIGVYGKIVSITETTYGKVAVLEIGDKVKTQMEVDMQVIAGKDEKQIAVYDKDNKLISLDGKPVELPKNDEVETKKPEVKTESKVENKEKTAATAKKTKKTTTKSKTKKTK